MPPRPPHSSHVPLIDRRTLLRLAGTAAATPGLSVLGGIATAGDAKAAGRAKAAASKPQHAVTLGGAPVRPPSIPLAVRSPYLSTWLPATDLAATAPQFWTGAARGLAGLIRIDGRVYRWAGTPAVGGTVPPAMRQTSVEVTATRSVFTFRAGGVELVAEWLSPVEPGDLRWQSVPLSLLTVSVTATDRRRHSVQVYVDITGEWVSSDESAAIEWHTAAGNGTRHWAVQLQDQQPVTESDQMTEWGTAVWATPTHPGLSYQSGAASHVRGRFAARGTLANHTDTTFRAIDDRQPVFAFAREMGTADAGSVAFAVGHVRTPLVSYGQDSTPLIPLWTRYWADWQTMTRAFLAGAAAARKRAVALDARIERAATEAAGPGYSAICALALRQCYGGTELAIGPQGQPWLLGKEISSDGDTNTVDIFDQAFLAWLWMDPDLIPLVMAPILDWCASSAWQDPSYWGTGSPYCVHDLGVYPVATGRVPGNGEQMPVEESAGMLIMAAAYARAVGASAATPFLSKWQLLWTQWANYLLTQVPFPSEQLTTDDWAPEHANLVNLGIKAIIGLAAAAQIATILGDSTNASTWSSAATGNVGTWQRESTDTSGNYLNLYEGGTGTWSCLYNAYYQMVIGESLVTDSVASMQASFYLNQLTTYGMPLESDVSETNKVAWLFYLAAWLSSYPIAGELMTRNIAYINDTPSLVPYGDRYNTSTGVEASGVEAHPTLGAVFAILAASGPAYAGTEQAASDPADPATRSGQSSASGQPTAQAARAPGASHKRKVKRKTVKRKPRKRKAVKRKPVSHKRKPAKGKARKRQAPKRKRR